MAVRVPGSAMVTRSSRSAMATRGSRSAVAAWVPGSAMGPGTGTALEATCPVSKSLRPPERPPPLPFRCHPRELVSSSFPLSPLASPSSPSSPLIPSSSPSSPLALTGYSPASEPPKKILGGAIYPIRHGRPSPRIRHGHPKLPIRHGHPRLPIRHGHPRLLIRRGRLSPRIRRGRLSPKIRRGRLSPRIRRGRLSPRIRLGSRNGHRPGGRLSSLQVLEASRAPTPPSPFDIIRRRTRLGGRGGNVTVCLPLPCISLPIFGFSCHHYLISLHLCLDFVPGVSSYVPLHIVCSAPCFGWIIVNVSTSVSVCTCLCHLRVLFIECSKEVPCLLAPCFLAPPCNLLDWIVTILGIIWDA